MKTYTVTFGAASSSGPNIKISTTGSSITLEALDEDQAKRLAIEFTTASGLPLSDKINVTEVKP